MENFHKTLISSVMNGFVENLFREKKFKITSYEVNYGEVEHHMEQGLPVSSNFDEIEIVDNLYDFILKLDRMSPSDISGILSSLITTGEAEYEDAHTEREINYSFYLLPVDLED